MRQTRYQQIADEVRERVGAGELGPGRLLPSEAELSLTYHASRVTVRRALEVLREEGLVDSRQGFGWFVAAPAHVCMVLDSETVLRVRRLNLADDEPFALVTVWCPERYGAELSRADVERSPFYELLGIELGGAVQTIGAAVASARDAELLAVPVGSPVLRCERVTSSITGEVVLVSEHTFPAHLTEFVVDLPHAEASIAPSGFRLVE